MRSESPAQVRFLSTSSRANDEVALVPYVCLEDGWTLPDSVVLEVAAKSIVEGTFSRVFYDGPVTDPDSFMLAMQDSGNVPIFVFRGGDPIGAAWLNGCSGNRAFGHFFLLRSAWGRSTVEAGRMALEYWFGFRQGGQRVFDVILGVTPTENAHAVRFAERIGMTVLGSIPNMIRDRSGRLSAATVSYATR